jgi:hypothetical protein
VAIGYHDIEASLDLALAPTGHAGPLARARVILRRSRLDRELARGADPNQSELLAIRARQLTGEHNRRQLAEGIGRLIDEAGRPRRGLSSALPVSREEIALALPQLRQIQAMLAIDGTVYSRGVAMLNCLLTDGGSPLFTAAYRGELRDTLEAAIAALQGDRALDRGRE